MDYKTVKFNGVKYPYIVLNLYDYNLNRDVETKVSTMDLQEELFKALTSPDEELKKKAEVFDSDIKTFIPRNILMKKNEEEIIKWISNKLNN